MWTLGIVWANDQNWFDQVQKSHAQISAKFLGYTRWWWVTECQTRCPPMGQEHLLSRSFCQGCFRMAFMPSDIREVYLVGCPREVAVYLKEFKSDLVLDRETSMGIPDIFISFYSSMSLWLF